MTLTLWSFPTLVVMVVAAEVVLVSLVIALSEMQQQSGKRMMPLDEKTVSNLLLALNECNDCCSWWMLIEVFDVRYGMGSGYYTGCYHYVSA